jgi:hypothetical protein
VLIKCRGCGKISNARRAPGIGYICQHCGSDDVATTLPLISCRECDYQGPGRKATEPGYRCPECGGTWYFYVDNEGYTRDEPPPHRPLEPHEKYGYVPPPVVVESSALTPHVCPVCKGSGQVAHETYSSQSIFPASDLFGYRVSPMVRCRSCVKGIVWR